jgi:hypothetical protein
VVVFELDDLLVEGAALPSGAGKAELAFQKSEPRASDLGRGSEKMSRSHLSRNFA